MTRDPKDEYSKEETERRFLAALRGAQVVGHKDRETMKLGKPRAKSAQSPKRKTTKKTSA
jgi:hypothetical protein